MEKTTMIKIENMGGNVMLAYAEKDNHLYLMNNEIGLSIYEMTADDYFGADVCSDEAVEKMLFSVSEDNILYYSKKEQLTDLSVDDLEKVIESSLDMADVKNIKVDSQLVKSLISFYDEKTK